MGVIDYGCGNLFSLEAGLGRVGLEPVRVRNYRDASTCQGLVIPGVGSYAAGMRGLQDLDMSEFIKEWAVLDKPLLGICLGMQLMLEGSEEASGVEGLGLVRGIAKRLWGPFAVPHMGWNYVTGGELWGFGDDFYYFVHSYYAELVEPQWVIAETDHNIRIPAALKWGNTLGLQFHPEKSGQQGIRLLREWGESIV